MFRCLICAVLLTVFSSKTILSTKYEPPPGGQRVINMSDVHVYESVAVVVHDINRDRSWSEEIPHLSLVEVLNGTIQVVTGEEYRLIFVVGESVCNNSEANADASTEECPLQTNAIQRRKQCTSMSIYRNWETPKVFVQEFQCDDIAPVTPERGGQKNINKTDPGVKISAEGAVNEINRVRGYGSGLIRLSLFDIDGGTVQIVDGSIYRLLLKLADSTCMNTEDHANATTDECPVPAGMFPSKMCSTVVSWVHWKTPETVVEHFECYDLPPPPLPPGGQKPINMSDAGVKISAQAAVNQINENRGYSDTIQRQSLGTVNGGTIQDVDGQLYRLQFSIGDSVCKNDKNHAKATAQQCPIQPDIPALLGCQASVVYKPWSVPVATVLSTVCQELHTQAFKYQPPPPGGKQSINMSDPHVYDSVNAVLHDINRDRLWADNVPRLTLMRVVNGTIQEVEGAEYSLLFIIGDSVCNNSEVNANATVEQCPPKTNGIIKRKECTSLSIYMEGNVFVENFSCLDIAPEVPPGYPTKINMSDPAIPLCVNTAVNEINAERGYNTGLKRLSLDQVRDGTVQIVDGAMYRLLISLSDSMCFNTEVHANATTKECPIPKSVAPSKLCSIAVLYEQWKTPETKIEYYECYDFSRKRAASERNLADFAVNKINKAIGYSCCTYKYVLASIDSSSITTSETVNGTIKSSVMTVKIGESFCTNNELNKDRTSATCQIQPGSDLKTCNVMVDLPTSANTDLELRNYSCDSIRTRRRPVSEGTLADFAVNEINRAIGYSCCTYRYVVESIVSSTLTTTQTVNGTVKSSVMTVKMGESFCTNNDLNKDRTAADCPLQPGLHLKTCDVIIDLPKTESMDLKLRRYSCDSMGTPAPIG